MEALSRRKEEKVRILNIDILSVRKQELLEIAYRLFLQKGYEETSVKDILDALQMSKGGFYHHFGSKEELLGESLCRIMVGAFCRAAG